MKKRINKPYNSNNEYLISMNNFNIICQMCYRLKLAHGGQ